MAIIMKQITILSQFFYNFSKKEKKKTFKKLRIKNIFHIVLVNFIHKIVFVPCTLVTIRINP